MRKRHSRIAAVAATAAAAALAAYALRPTAASTPTAGAAGNRAAEVRTQVIRRTIHVVHHAPATSGAGSTGTSSRQPSAYAQAPGSIRTGASGGHARSYGASGSLATRASGARTSSYGASGSLATASAVRTPPRRPAPR